MEYKTLTVKKSHELVTAKFQFGLQEMRLFCMLVSMIDDRDEDFKTYKIPVKEIIRTFRITSNTIYAELRELTRSMLKKVITIPLHEDGQDKELQLTLMSSFKYNVDGRGLLEVTFHPALKPYLLQVKNRYLLYDIKHILKIGSANSIRMYELLKSYQGLWKRVFWLSELKEILGVEDKYAKYSNFKKRIILKAQRDLTQHTDISFTFEEETPHGGRKVERLVFYISANKGKQKIAVPQVPPANENEQTNTTSLIKKLGRFGLSKAVITTQIIGSYDKEYIEGTLKYCQQYFKQHAVESPWGFILQALKKGYYKEELHSKKQKKETKVTVEEWENEEEKAHKKAQLEDLRNQYQTDDFVQQVLQTQEGTILYTIMKRDWEAGKMNKFLQGFVDRELEQQYGMKGGKEAAESATAS